MFNATRLKVRFRESLPPRTLPKHVRKLCLGIVENTHPAWNVVCNRELIYPRLHYRLPGRDAFYFLGVGKRGSQAITALIEAFQNTETLVLGNQRLTLRGVEMEPMKFDLQVSSRLFSYVLRSPMHLFSQAQRFKERTGDLVRDYETAFTRHLAWLFQQFGVEPQGNFRVHFRDILENNLPLMPERIPSPAMVKGRIITNVALPPAVGHGTGLGWGNITRVNTHSPA